MSYRHLLPPLLLTLCLLAGVPARGQQQCAWLHLADKDGVSFDPQTYFSTEAQLRRALQGLPPYTYSDLPVRADYVATLTTLTDTVYYASRWLNAVAVRATEAQLATIATLPWVRRIEVRQPQPMEPAETEGEAEETKAGKIGPDGYRQYQMTRLGEEHMREANLNGKGVIVAVLDAGFPNVNTGTHFKHLEIIDTWDFVDGEQNVYEHNSHGTNVLSCIAGRTDAGAPIGLASGARFLLARTEKAKGEIFEEEVWWAAALEWADKKGADVINSSLGYGLPRYHRGQMNGNHTLVTRTANTAAEKGILVVNAMGNEGSGDWKYLAAPADADSIISVGGTNPKNDHAIGFSSHGPTADGRLKPNVCAPAHTAVSTGSTLTTSYGTSFASPLVAGFAACARQLYPQLPVMELKAKIEEAGHLYPYFDYRHGYGIPQATHLLAPEDTMAAPLTLTQPELGTVENEDGEEYQTLEVRFEPIGEQDLPAQLYYHIRDDEGRLKAYWVAMITKTGTIKLEISTEDKDFTLDETDILYVHYEGYTYRLPLVR